MFAIHNQIIHLHYNVKSSALSTSALLIFVMQEINDALFLKANFLSYALLSGSVTVLVPSTAIYTSL